MSRVTRLIEAAQDITILAWERVYGFSDDFEDSRTVLAIFREWAEKFEKWWEDHWLNAMYGNLDYMEEIEKFTDKKVEELLCLE